MIFTDFKISDDEVITRFFPDKKHSFLITLESKVNRTLHFFQTGLWINELVLCKWAEDHPEKKVSEIFKNKPLFRKLRRYEKKMVVKPTSFLTSLKEGLIFLWRFIRSPRTVGSLAPSSKGLAKAIVRQIPKIDTSEKRYILEVGPGTGIFTDKIIKRMNPEDELHLVEFDDKFCQQLKEKYQHIPNVKVYAGSIADFDPQVHLNMPEGLKYQFVISGLPLNAFLDTFVDDIFWKYQNITAEGGKISYFEYMLLPSIKKVLLNKEGRKNLNSILEKKRDFYRRFGQAVDKVWINITPAKVLHHEIKTRS